MIHARHHELHVLYRIRCAIGDKEGKLMHDEVVEKIKGITARLKENYLT